jgi:hypothetical protein
MGNFSLHFVFYLDEGRCHMYVMLNCNLAVANAMLTPPVELLAHAIIEVLSSMLATAAAVASKPTAVGFHSARAGSVTPLSPLLKSFFCFLQRMGR